MIKYQIISFYLNRRSKFWLACVFTWQSIWTRNTFKWFEWSKILKINLILCYFFLFQDESGDDSDEDNKADSTFIQNNDTEEDSNEPKVIDDIEQQN